jgi:RNA polymerase sigma-70 factor (ECF subfamily)
MTDDGHERLGQIPTLWTLVRRAHEGDDSHSAQGQILERYGGAVRRYLQGALRDADAADELFQEFALRLVHGDLRGAAPDRGRFRDYVKGVLVHLVADHHNRRRRQPTGLASRLVDPPDASTPAGELDRAFTESWRDELLARAWSGLNSLERHTGQPFYSVLRLRADHPELRSPDLACKLSEQLDKPITSAGVRQLLHRAREKFAELVLDDVAQTLSNAPLPVLEEELTELGLLVYCRPALQRRS